MRRIAKSTRKARNIDGIEKSFRVATKAILDLTKSLGRSRKSSTEYKALAEESASVYKILMRLLELPEYDPFDLVWIETLERRCSEFDKACLQLKHMMNPTHTHRSRSEGCPPQSQLDERVRSLSRSEAYSMVDCMTRIRELALGYLESCAKFAKLNTFQGQKILQILIEEGRYAEADGIIERTRDQLLDVDPRLWFLVAAYSGDSREADRFGALCQHCSGFESYISAAFFVAVERANTNIVQALLWCGEDVDARNDLRQTALHRATRLENEDMMKVLLQHGADVDAVDEDQRTPWSANLERRNEHVLGILLEAGANPNTTGSNGVSRIYPAAANGDTDLVRYMLRNGTDPSIRTSFDWAPLHWAACHGQVDCVKLLLEFGAEVDPVSDTGKTPLDLASANHRTAIVQLLKAARQPLTREDSLDSLDQLLAESDCGRSVNSYESTPAPTETVIDEGCDFGFPRLARANKKMGMVNSVSILFTTL